MGYIAIHACLEIFPTCPGTFYLGLNILYKKITKNALVGLINI